MPSPIHIAVIVPLGLGYGRWIARGVMTYAPPAGNWIMSLEDSQYGRYTLAGRRDSPPDGIIAHVNSDELAGALMKADCPVVNTSNAVMGLPFLQMRLDNHGIGEMAAKHFLDRGFRCFGFYSSKSASSSIRQQGFLNTLAAAAIRSDAISCWRVGEPRLLELLAACPKPVGVFAAGCVESWCMSELCRNGGLHVPDEVALLGVDNDEFYCELAHPKLSSIRLPLTQLGCEAAAALDRLLQGTTPVPPLLKPVEVVTRQSTDVMAVGDADVAAALRYIRANSRRPLKIANILESLNVSRRSLEYKFQKELGRTPLQEIHQVQVDHARSLLASGDMTMRAVAAECGFSNPVQFWSVFKRLVGMSPTEFRRHCR